MRTLTTSGDTPPRQARAGNRYDFSELAGAFGDLGTLVPFVVGYIVVLGVDPAGIFLTFGLAQVAVGLHYRTPMPVQPMKAIGTAAIASGGAITSGMVCGAGLFTGAFWLLAARTRLIDAVSRLAARPIVNGIVLGLGLSFMLQGIHFMGEAPWVAAAGVTVTVVLLSNRRVPAMFALLLVGVGVALVTNPAFAASLASMRPVFRFPPWTLGQLTRGDFLAGVTLLALPQLPLTFGNAIIAVRAENNALFPDRPVTDRHLALSQGLINLAAAPLGGIPLCHGAGGMAGHVRFGARTGGAPVMLGLLMIAAGLLCSETIGAVLAAFPRAIVGVILFFAGLELATAGAGGQAEITRRDVSVTLVVAALAMWNMGAAFVAGVALHALLRRDWIRL